MIRATTGLFVSGIELLGGSVLLGTEVPGQLSRWRQFFYDDREISIDRFLRMTYSPASLRKFWNKTPQKR
jgi:hypothetical protein